MLWSAKSPGSVCIRPSYGKRLLYHQETTWWVLVCLCSISPAGVELIVLNLLLQPRQTGIIDYELACACLPTLWDWEFGFFLVVNDIHTHTQNALKAFSSTLGSKGRRRHREQLMHSHVPGFPIVCTHLHPQLNVPKTLHAFQVAYDPLPNKKKEAIDHLPSHFFH